MPRISDLRSLTQAVTVTMGFESDYNFGMALYSRDSESETGSIAALVIDTTSTRMDILMESSIATDEDEERWRQRHHGWGWDRQC